MVRGLVAVGVLANHASDVALVTTSGLAAGVEERVEEGLCLLLASYLGNPASHVVGHVGAVLPTVGLGEVVVHLSGVKGGDETSVAAGVHKSVGIHDILPRLCASHVGVVYFLQVMVGG